MIFTKEQYEQLYERQRREAEGSRLFSERMELGITGVAMADLMGISTSRLHRLERGEPVKFARQLVRQYEMVLENKKMKIYYEYLLSKKASV